MFGEPLFAASRHVRAGEAQLFSEFIATFGLLAVTWRRRASSRPKTYLFSERNRRRSLKPEAAMEELMRLGGWASALGRRIERLGPPLRVDSAASVLNKRTFDQFFLLAGVLDL